MWELYEIQLSFSKMDYIKSYYRSVLTDDHLQKIWMIEGTNTEPH